MAILKLYLKERNSRLRVMIVDPQDERKGNFLDMVAGLFFCSFSGLLGLKELRVYFPTNFKGAKQYYLVLDTIPLTVCKLVHSPDEVNTTRLSLSAEIYKAKRWKRSRFVYLTKPIIKMSHQYIRLLKNFGKIKW